MPCEILTRIIHLVLPLNNILLLAKLEHINKEHEMFCKKSKTHIPSLSRHIGSREETGDKSYNCPSQASAIVITPGRNQQWRCGKQSSPWNRPIAWSCQITMLGNYYFAIVGHYDNPVFEMEFNPPMKTMDSSQSRDQSHKVRLRLWNQKSMSTNFLHCHLPPLLFSVVIKDISRQDTHIFLRIALFKLR